MHRLPILRWLGVLICSLIITLVGCHTRTQVIRIAYDPSWRNLQTSGMEPQLNGFFMDLMPIVAERTGIPLEGLRIGQTAIWRSLDDGESRAALTTQTPTLEQRQQYAFSEPLIYTGTSLIQRISDPKIDPNNLKGVSVGVQSDSAAFFEIVRRPGVHFRQYMANIDALNDLAAGKINAVAMERIPALAITRGGFRNVLQVVEQPLNTNPGIRLVMKKDDPLFERLAKAFLEGDTRKLQSQWGLAP